MTSVGEPFNADQAGHVMLSLIQCVGNGRGKGGTPPSSLSGTEYLVPSTQFLLCTAYERVASCGPLRMLRQTLQPCRLSVFGRGTAYSVLSTEQPNATAPDPPSTVDTQAHLCH